MSYEVINMTWCVCQEKDDPALSQNAIGAEQYFDRSSVECAIQSCPEVLKQGSALILHSSHNYQQHQCSCRSLIL